jgi:Fe-S-cluster containining protein
MAQRAIRAFDWYTDVVAKEPPPTPAVQCKRGCSACCYQFTGVLLPEAIAIVVRHRAVVDSVQSKMAADTWHLGKIFKSLGYDETTPAIDLDEEQRNAIANAWWKLRRPCPFLDEEKGECRVYDSRPIACRSYHVISDPELCGAAEPTEVTAWRPKVIEATAKIIEAQGGGMITSGAMAEIVLYALREMK